MRIRHVLTGFALILCAALLPHALHAEPLTINGWRGPERTGAAANFEAPKAWPQTLQKKWQLEVGEGHSSPVVVGEHIYQFSRDGDHEILRCIGKDGKEVWRQSYDAPYKMNNAARGHGKGPKSTPLVAGNRVYTLGIAGTFQSRQTSDGKLLWQAGDQLPKGSPLYGAATSPLVMNDLAIIHLGKHNGGGIAALDVETGRTRWIWSDDGPAYTSPVVMEFSGQRQIVTQSQKFCLSFSPDGKLLWKLPFTTGYDQNSVTPVQVNDTVIFSGFRKGVTAYRPKVADDQWHIDEVWNNSDISMYMNSPVLAGERIFGYSEKNKGQLFCLNAATGKTIWLGPPRQGENAALWVVGNFVTAQLTDGRFVVVDAKADEYVAVAEYALSNSPVWAHPALFDQSILVKNETSLTLWSLK